jgi:hypothetical protein
MTSDQIKLLPGFLGPSLSDLGHTSEVHFEVLADLSLTLFKSLRF